MKLSAYILTYNSERYIGEIIDKLSCVADEILILDSGSTDSTINIASQSPKVVICYRSFDNFKEQRNYAAMKCAYNAVFFVDSDEIPDKELINSLKKIKEEQNELKLKAYSVKRQWEVLGRSVHAIYPVVCPDNVVRLFDRRYVSFADNSNIVHETIEGYDECICLEGNLRHKTFHTKEELLNKVEHYTDLAAEELIRRKKRVSSFKIIFSPIAGFIKWYFLKKGFLDRKVGLILGMYAYKYTKLKYIKARRLKS